MNNQYGVTQEEFIIAWEKAKTLEEVARQLGMPKETCSARAQMYRNKKIKLKSFPKGKEGLDVDRLNKIVQLVREGKPIPEDLMRKEEIPEKKMVDAQDEEQEETLVEDNNFRKAYENGIKSLQEKGLMVNGRLVIQKK